MTWDILAPGQIEFDEEEIPLRALRGFLRVPLKSRGSDGKQTPSCAVGTLLCVSGWKWQLDSLLSLKISFNLNGITRVYWS